MSFTIKYVTQAAIVILMALAVAFIVVKWQLMGGAVLIGFPIVVGFLAIVFYRPLVGMYALLAVSFLSNGLVRYVPAPLGLAVDALLVITILAVFVQKFYRQDWQHLRQNWVLRIILLWAVYCFFQLLNPESRSVEAWFYAVRGVALYLVLTVVLGLQLMNTQPSLQRFLNIWLSLSSFAALYGIKQLYFGLDTAEQNWLNAGNASTHILHGKLRVFSFYSDAGQFGASMAHAGLTALILTFNKAAAAKQRFVYAIVAMLCFYGMAISGTRGALFVPLAGIGVYLVLVKNFKAITVGLLAAGLLFGLLKFTYIGQSNYQIQRMRSALDPNDPSLLVRLENQKKLSLYLNSRPLGGGIGSAGYWGLRFSPNTFLAQTPTDSWYVKIWAETGIVGLTLHLGMIFFLLIFFFRKIWSLPPSTLRQQLMALYAGLVGIAAASYGNQLLGQMPTGTVIYLSISFLYTLTKYPTNS
jgi:hypothetical protein